MNGYAMELETMKQRIGYARCGIRDNEAKNGCHGIGDMELKTMQEEL